jgi:hypothetical protein
LSAALSLRRALFRFVSSATSPSISAMRTFRRALWRKSLWN